MESMQERLRWSKELQLAGMNLDSVALSLQLKGGLAGPPVVRLLNLSGNMIANFSDNCLPSLEVLDLGGNYLFEFSRNTLPNLNSFSFGTC